MSKLTTFGLALRKLRLDHRLRLLDLARMLDVSTAFLSAVETGRKPIPDGFVNKLSRALNLAKDEIAELTKARDRTRKEVRLDTHSEPERELIAAFARRLDELPPEMIDDIKKIILKSQGGEGPFERRRKGIVVPPLSTQALRQFAEKVRAAFIPADQIEFPIVEVLEWAMPRFDSSFVLSICDAEEMGDDEGRVPVGGNELILRSDVYEGACKGAGRDRFTAAHEFAHYLLHRQIKLARARSDEDKIYTDSEWQADTFAGTLLVSPRHAKEFENAEQTAEACMVTVRAATVIREKYREEGIIQ